MPSYYFWSECMGLSFIEILMLSMASMVMLFAVLGIIHTAGDVITHLRFRKTRTYRMLKAKGYYN